MINDLLKKPSFWAVIVPVVFACLAFHGAMTMGRCKHDAQYQMDNAFKARQAVTVIHKAEQQMGITGRGAIDYFGGFSSALECAKQGQISERTISRGESAKPQLQKDGSFLHRETYILNKVYLIQIARFIDAAERNYYSVHCAQLTLNPAGGKTRDNWIASIRLEYITR